ncbi:hypothetical protein [Streptomyces sp. NPDC048142]|uniref:hypothetical protein n=1 Tax=Streptomyces sp. NPDC048142 TaxID=3365501 RepID=UPI003714E842
MRTVASARVPALLGADADRDEYAKQDRCPTCGQAEGIRFLGAGVAPLASVAVTQLFTGGELPKEDAEGNDRRKTLIYNDSVQDAAHRAGFVASRAWKFSLRSLVQKQLVKRAAENPDFASEGVPAGMPPAPPGHSNLPGPTGS